MDFGAAALGGATLSGGLGLLGTGFQYLANKSLASLQNQYNIDMWNRMNEYNSPQAQMQRYKDAGLNPLLIYGQGNNGNASSPPQMIAPEAPRIDKAMENLGKAFHLENLRKLHYEAEAAKEDADAKFIANQNARDERESQHDFARLYEFNPTTGKFESTENRKNVVYRDLTPSELEIKKRTGAYSTRSFRVYGHHFDYYRRSEPLSTIPYRNALLDWQKRYLVPQVSMRTFDAEHYPETFFIDRANKPAGLLYSLYNFLFR